jgi:NAD(P)-dependent dehydrogenase (short-subunit alcohol dehydrogenase family)
MKAAALFDVSGDITIVTGAASGLGLAMAEVMAANGARVVMADVDAGRLDVAVERIRASGGEVEGAVVDVTNSASLRSLIDGTIARHGHIDCVFANAGISVGPGFTSPAGEIERVSPDGWSRVLQVNVTSVFETLQLTATHMKARRSGRIIVTCSIAGLRSEPIIGYAYVASKHAVAGLIRQSARELAQHGVRVNGIAPGPFLTGIGGGRLHGEEFNAAFAALTPMGRVADPDEIKGVALLLASRASSYMTGTIISVDGGMIAK